LKHASVNKKESLTLIVPWYPVVWLLALETSVLLTIDGEKCCAVY